MAQVIISHHLVFVVCLPSSINFPLFYLLLEIHWTFVNLQFLNDVIIIKANVLLPLALGDIS